MKRAEMSLQDSRIIFDIPENYPLTILIDGQSVAMDLSQVRDLRLRNVDFEVDDHQANRILTLHGTC